eukprot:CAMPEP_0172800400 /NCGR_PEP_ID=MMETSP1075-20121228/2572_1 /TAXON_ID=2916 /ORGANISM="Ceratium fusus, Strain PA161109" /LENGTH=205 /DNA_ID=CAMNT_0013638315 /DNA_START=55 /DNA_END=669 /DNA_ORIENTATION=-
MASVQEVCMMGVCEETTVAAAVPAFVEGTPVGMEESAKTHSDAHALEDVTTDAVVEAQVEPEHEAVEPAMEDATTDAVAAAQVEPEHEASPAASAVQQPEGGSQIKEAAVPPSAEGTPVGMEAAVPASAGGTLVEMGDATSDAVAEAQVEREPEATPPAIGKQPPDEGSQIKEVQQSDEASQIKTTPSAAALQQAEEASQIKATP